MEMDKENKRKEEINKNAFIHDLILITAVFLFITTIAYAAFPKQLSLDKGNESIIKGKLNIEIYPTAVVCAETPCLVKHNLTVYNDQKENVTLALYKKENEQYILLAELGSTEGMEQLEFEIPMIYNYNGITTNVGRYLLISSDFKAKEFTIAESWEKYQSSAFSLINLGAYIVAPIIFLILIFILALVVRNAESRKYGKKGEYTNATLFEFARGKTTGERIGNTMANPIVWSIILLFSLILVCLITFSIYQHYDLFTKMEITFISLIASMVVPLLLMIITWYADIYEREPFRFVVGMFVYGIFAAMVAFLLNNFIMYIIGKSPEIFPLALMTAIISIIASPIIEEFLKILGLSLFSRHSEFDDALDGLLYGFAIGLGFAMYENWFYFLASVDPILTGIDTWISIILYRSVFNTLAHGCFVAFAGLILGYLKSRERYRPIYQFGLIPGLFLAILMHMVFNLTAYMDIVNIGGYRAIISSYNPVLVISISVAFVISYIFAAFDTKRINQEKKMKEEEYY
jgi:RsiW-degrading membrane proteinase PrsW (M82 family)